MRDKLTFDPRYPSSEFTQQINDVLLVSSFALWAMLIGFAPVMAWRMLLG